MDQLIPFILNHWALWLAFALLLLMILQMELGHTAGGVPLLNPQQVTNAINHEKACVVDIRPATEYQTGHILGSLNLAATVDEQVTKKLQKYKNKPIIVVCSAGQSALRYAATLRNQGFASVYVLKGGLSAWRGANLPLAKVNSQ